jgi:type IV pilus assembly protein PilY1
MDLYDTALGTSTANHGERQVSDPILRNGRVIFSTLVPSTSACDFGGTSWLMELDWASGSHLSFTPFDLNADSVFDADDYVTVNYDVNDDGVVDDDDKVPAGGKKSEVGIIPQPTILADEDREFKYTSGSTGAIGTVTENPGPGEMGRQSWRQLQ